MVATTTSPNTDNYYIGKGRLYVAPAGVSPLAWRAVGNAPLIETSPEFETLPHFSSMEGTKKKDKEVVISKSATLKITLEEMTPDNLALALMGESPSGGGPIEMYSLSNIELAVKFEGRNDIGPHVDMFMPRVSFKPATSFTPLSDEWGQMEIEGEILSDVNGSFGQVVWSDGASG